MKPAIIANRKENSQDEDTRTARRFMRDPKRWEPVEWSALAPGDIVQIYEPNATKPISTDRVISWFVTEAPKGDGPIAAVPAPGFGRSAS